ncbi:MAG: alpha/beta fold hydrolase [Pseudomonadales bacterium]|nr:alpha/beta fold hydrolase [Pseudomonadales bacterium]
MPQITLSTGSVHYCGHGSGIPVVLLHANPSDSKDFDAVASRLASSYRVIALDWPGYGQSDLLDEPASANVLLYFKVLQEFLEKLALPPAFFIGNSIVGNAAARLASQIPLAVRSLVLVASDGFTPQNFISTAFCKFQGSRFSISPYRLASLCIKKCSDTTKPV